MNASPKERVTFTLDKVALDYLDQMREITPRSSYVNYIICEYFKIKEHQKTINRMFENLANTRPDVFAKLLENGAQISSDLTDDEVKAIAGK